MVGGLLENLKVPGVFLSRLRLGIEHLLYFPWVLLWLNYVDGLL